MLDEIKRHRSAKAKKLAAANADKTPIIGGVDEPGLRPLRLGEQTHVLISAPCLYEFDATVQRMINQTDPHAMAHWTFATDPSAFPDADLFPEIYN